MTRICKIVASVASAAGASAYAGPVEVDFTSSTSLRGHGSFTGQASYDSANHTLSLDITNTSAASLTAIAFDVPTGDTATFDRPSKHSPWKNEFNHKGVINANPYGKFEGGAAVGGGWGSTNAKRGLAAGQSDVFTFDITGNNVSTLTTADFFTSKNPEIAASFAGFKHTRYHMDRAGGFGHVIAPTEITTPTGPGIGIIEPKGPSPIVPPVITVPSNGIKIPGGNGGTVSAVPLPSSAPVAGALLALIAAARYFRRRLGLVA